MRPEPADSNVRVVPPMTSVTVLLAFVTATQSSTKLAFCAAWVSVNEIGDTCPNPNKVLKAEIETALSAPVCVPEITSLTGLVALPSLIKLARALAPELLIASLIPSKVLLPLSMVIFVMVDPTVIEIVP